MKPTNDDQDAGASQVPATSAISPVALYRLDLAYNGKVYHGFQSQPSGNTVQDHLEVALSKFCRHPVRVTAASRTDSGVHAEQQVVTFKSAGNIDLYRIVKALNALLPPDIRVMRAAQADASFHPIFNSTGKVYRYWIWRSPGETPFINPFAWSLGVALDTEAMRSGSRHLIGTHDFTSFCAVDSTAKSKIRRLREVQIIERGPLLEIWCLGDGFLKQMVRNIVGCLVAVGKGKIEASEVKGILNSMDRSVAPSTAPAEGLCLVRIFYGDDLSVPSLLDQARSGYNVALFNGWM